MYIPTKLSSNRLFRLLWQVLCIPLELWLLLVKLRNILVKPITVIILLVVVLGLYSIFPDKFSGDERLIAIIFIAVLGFAALKNYRSSRPFGTPNPTWRLEILNKPAMSKRITASVVVTSHANPKENRTTMTKRLAPELQKLINTSNLNAS